MDSRVFPMTFHGLAGRDEKKPYLSLSGGLMLGMGMGFSPNPPREWKRLEQGEEALEPRRRKYALPTNID